MTHIVETFACPACGVEAGVRCTTLVGGVDLGWTHDARIISGALR